MAGAQAQESTNVIGGDASGSGGSAGYSVGQIVYHTFTGATGLLAEGVQQLSEKQGFLYNIYDTLIINERNK